MLEQQYLSISKSLKSNSRTFGPRLYCRRLDDIIGGNGDADKIYNSDFAKKVVEVIYNCSPAEYYEHTMSEYNTKITKRGALVAYSGVKTGRSPLDRRIVKSDKYDDDIWCAEPAKISDNVFFTNKETAIGYLNQLNKIYVFDGYACWHPEHKVKVRVISSRAYHCLFMYNMLIRPTEDELKEFGDPEITIYNAGCFPCNRYTESMTSSTSVNLNLETKEIVILGTQYAGEMKKGVFAMMNFFMPLKGILSLHSSCNISKDEQNIALFFGLSGTGKTTLSADPERKLIGDDEHCWDDNGVFNIEGGCYAKCINLRADKEPDIFNAIRFGALFENVMLGEHSREVDFTDATITENIRLSYPINFINNAHIPCIAGHPNNIILLTCDAFGVLPMVCKLNEEQAMYHFISGYTSKAPGTEDGVDEPEAVFSACYGEAFLLLHPTKYAKLLAEKLVKHNAHCWLVNTGWVGGKYGVGKRCDINITREIVSSIHDGSLLSEEFSDFNLLDMNMRTPTKYTHPRNLWKDKQEYDSTLSKLEKLFTNNYKKYE
jgi:phosphoenolpyruvate carboxykinase (ATP)